MKQVLVLAVKKVLTALIFFKTEFWNETRYGQAITLIDPFEI